MLSRMENLRPMDYLGDPTILDREFSISIGTLKSKFALWFITDELIDHRKWNDLHKFTNMDDLDPDDVDFLQDTYCWSFDVSFTAFSINHC